MIDENRLIEEIKKRRENNIHLTDMSKTCHIQEHNHFIAIVLKQPKVNEWIPI